MASGAPTAADDAADDGARTGDGHLLSDDGTDGGLERVDAARHAQTRRRGDEVGEHGVVSESSVDGDRVGVEVEQAAHAPNRRREVAPVGEAEGDADVGPPGSATASAETSATPWPLGSASALR